MVEAPPSSIKSKQATCSGSRRLGGPDNGPPRARRRRARLVQISARSGHAHPLPQLAWFDLSRASQGEGTFGRVVVNAALEVAVAEIKDAALKW